MNQPPDVSKPAVQGPGGGGEGVWNQAVEAVEAVHQEPPLCAALGQHVALVGDDHIQDLLQLILLRKQTQRNSTHCWRLVFLNDSPRRLQSVTLRPPCRGFWSAVPDRWSICAGDFLLRSSPARPSSRPLPVPRRRSCAAPPVCAQRSAAGPWPRLLRAAPGACAEADSGSACAASPGGHCSGGAPKKVRLFLLSSLTNN